MSPDVSIIFVNYHTSRLIADCIQSIKDKVADITYEIIIVDNNSETNLDNSLSHIISPDMSVKYIYLEKNIGFGRANNEGAKKSSGKFLFFLNPDTILLNNAVKILFDFLNSHPQAGACGGNLIDSLDTPAHSFRKIFPGIKWEFQEFTHHFFSHPKNSRKRFYNFSPRPLKVAYISGADLMVRKELFQRSGGFPDDIFMYWDDVEICKKIKNLGYKIFSVPEARIRHLESRSFDNKNISNTFKIELQEKYRLIYLKRNLRPLNNLVANLLYSLFLDSRRILTKGNKKEYYNKRKFFFNKFKSSY